MFECVGSQFQNMSKVLKGQLLICKGLKLIWKSRLLIWSFKFSYVFVTSLKDRLLILSVTKRREAVTLCRREMPERPIRLSEIMLKGAVQTFLELLKGIFPTYISIFVGFKMCNF